MIFNNCNLTMRTFLYVFISTILLISCNPRIDNNLVQEEAIKISIPKLNSNVIRYSEIFDSVKIVRLETNNNSLIGRIDKLLHYSDKFFILDRNMARSIFVFNADGKFLCKIGKLGKGPGEYFEPRDIAIDPFRDNIIVYDNFKRRLLFYDFEGQFIEDIQLDFFIGSFSILDENQIALYFDNLENNIPFNDSYNLQIINRKGKTKYKTLKYNDIITISNSTKVFFYKTQDALLLSPDYSNTIYSVQEKLLIPKYVIDAGQSIPDELFEGKSAKEFASALKGTDYILLDSYIETPNHLVFSMVLKKNGMIYNGFYSKTTQKLFCGNLYINDVYGLLTSSIIESNDEDWIISYSESPNLVDLKDILSRSNTNGSKYKDEVSKKLHLIEDEYINSFRKAFKMSTFNITKEELELIYSIKPSDNPIIFIAKMKDF